MALLSGLRQQYQINNSTSAQLTVRIADKSESELIQRIKANFTAEKTQLNQRKLSGIKMSTRVAH